MRATLPSTPLATLFKVLGDTTRLRILALLVREELSVGDLSRVLGLAQSRVSNHLRVLRDAGLLIERHVGSSTFLRSALASAPDGGQEAPTASRVWASLQDDLSEMPEHAADRLRLSDLLAERRAESRDFFDALAGEWDKVGAQFATGQARERAVASLLPAGLVLADLGCGTGYVARSLAGLAATLVCVDRSQGMLDAARARLDPPPAGTRLDFRRGELDALPIATGELDGAVAGMVLHHLEDLDGPLREMRRAVRPGGSAAVIELAPHREEWMHRALGDRHLGLEPGDVAAAFRRAGFTDVRIENTDDRYCPPPPPDRGGGDAGREVRLPLYIVRGRVPSGGRPDASNSKARA